MDVETARQTVTIGVTAVVCLGTLVVSCASSTDKVFWWVL
jgi:hypothetical protein